MKYRWRGTSVLSFFLISALFSRIINEWSNWGGGTLKEILIENLYFGIPLIASFIIIFTLATKAVHKKASDYRFPRKWLMKYNLFLFIKTLIFFEVIGVALISLLLKFQGSTGESWLAIYIWSLYTPIVALAAVMFFSLIPSIIILRTHPNKKTRKMLFIAFIVISVLIFITSLVSIFNCQFGYAGKCLAMEAINKKDIGLCDNGLTEGSKDRCYNYVIFHGELRLSEEFCDSLPRLKESCLIKLGIETNNPELCGGDNGCLASVAHSTKNIELCRILDSTEDYQENLRNQCIWGVAVKTENISLCDEMTSNYRDNNWIHERCVSGFS